jgi:hypothetical protein
MAKSSEPRTPTWAAFAAGAVAMLVVVLLWAAWNSTHEAGRLLRADLALSRAADLPSLPRDPPPTGPRLPRFPLPGPR